MPYHDDLKRIFREDGLFSSCEISLYGTSALVISGHRGLTSLSSEEIVVRRKRGSIRVSGSDLRLIKASPVELYVSGHIRAVEYLDPRAEAES